MRNQAREELLLTALNRKHPQETEWKCAERSDGDLRFTAGDVVRILPAFIFHQKPSVLDVFAWIEEHWDLDPEYIARQRKLMLRDIK